MSAGQILTGGLGGFSDTSYLLTLGLGAYSESAEEPYQATPGFLKKSYELWLEREESRRAEITVEEAVEPAPRRPSAAVAAKSSNIVQAIVRLNDEADASRVKIAALQEKQAADVQAKELAALEKRLLLERQALLLAETQQAVFMEEMEVLDVAYFAAMAVSMRH